MIDIHSHILPRLDDGAVDLTTSLAMATLAAADGIQTMIATPHVGGGDSLLSMAKIQHTVEQLNRVLQQQKISLNVLPGAEVQSHIALELADQYCLAGGSFFLLEFPHTHLPADSVDLVYSLVGQGLTPIVAHPERNRSIATNPELLIPLVDAGAKAQVTAGSITGELGPDARVCAQFLLKRKLVHFIATDSHSPNFRKPILSKGLKKAQKIIGKADAQVLVEKNPLAIIPCIN